MNRAGYHLGASGAVPKAPLPFTLPSRKREGGTFGADGHIAGAGAKWASPGAACAVGATVGATRGVEMPPGSAPLHGPEYGQSTAALPPTAWMPCALPPSALHCASVPDARFQQVYAAGAGASELSAALSPSDVWNAPKGRGPAATPRTEFPALPTVAVNQSVSYVQTTGGHGPVPSSSAPTCSSTSNVECSACPAAVSCVRPSDPATTSTLRAEEAPVGAPYDEIDWADDDVTRKPVELASPLPDVVLPPPPALSTRRPPQRVHHAPSQPSRDVTQGMAMPSRSIGGEADGSHAPPSTFYAATTAALVQEAEKTQMDSSAAPRQYRTFGSTSVSLTTVEKAIDLDIETVKYQHDLMKRKAEIAAERRRANEMEEQRKRKGAEQKLRELEARLASRPRGVRRSVGNPLPATPELSPESSAQVSTPKILLRRTRESDGTHPPSRSDLASGRRGLPGGSSFAGGTPAEEGEKLAALRAAPSPYRGVNSSTAGQLRICRYERSETASALAAAFSSAPSSDEDGKSPDESHADRLERRRAKNEAKETARIIVGLCINRAMDVRSSQSDMQARVSQGSVKSCRGMTACGTGAVTGTAGTLHGMPDQRPTSCTVSSVPPRHASVQGGGDAEAGITVHDAQAEPTRKKPGRKRGGRVERSKRERREARAAAAAAFAIVTGSLNDSAPDALADDLNSNETRHVSSLLVIGSGSGTHVSRGSSATSPPNVSSMRSALARVVDSGVSTGAWDSSNRAVPPTSFDDISRAFANHPTTIPLAGAPLVGTVAMCPRNNTVLNCPWAAGGARQRWEHAKPPSTPSTSSAWIVTPPAGAQSASTGAIAGWNGESVTASLELTPQSAISAFKPLSVPDPWSTGGALQRLRHGSSSSPHTPQTTRHGSTGAWTSAHFAKDATASTFGTAAELEMTVPDIRDKMATISSADTDMLRTPRRLGQRSNLKKRPDDDGITAGPSTLGGKGDSVVSDVELLHGAKDNALGANNIAAIGDDIEKLKRERGGRPRGGGRRGAVYGKARVGKEPGSRSGDQLGSIVPGATTDSPELDGTEASRAKQASSSDGGEPALNSAVRGNGKRRSRGHGHIGGKTHRGRGSGQVAAGTNRHVPSSPAAAVGAVSAHAASSGTAGS